MKPQTQEFPIHAPELGSIGDCLRAAVASVLEMPLENVPHFARDYGSDPRDSRAGVYSFLGKLGYFPYEIPYIEGHDLLKWQKTTFGIDCHHLVFGVDHDGDPHACVGLNGDVVYDPHPLRRGLSDAKEHWRILLFIALDPSRSGATDSNLNKLQGVNK